MSRARLGLLQVTLAGLLWGTTGVIVQLVRDRSTLSPVSIGWYRLAIAAIALLLLRPRLLRGLVGALRRDPVRLVVVGVALGAYQAAYFISVAAVGVGLATMISLGLAPVCVAVWESTTARRPPRPVFTGSLVAGVVGLILISVAGGHTTTGPQRPLLGVVAAVLSGLGYAASTVLSRAVAQTTDAVTLTAGSALFGALALLPFAAYSGLGFPWRASTVSLLGFVGVAATAVAYLFFYTGLQTTPGSVAAVLTLLEPVTATVLAVVVLGEPLTALEGAGGVLVLLAVVVLYLDPSPPAPELDAPPP